MSAVFFTAGIYYNSGSKESDQTILNGNKTVNPNEQIEKKDESFNQEAQRADKGIASMIGSSAEKLKAQYGEPDRIDPSAYGYDWWIYHRSDDDYFQFGVSGNKVVTAYGLGDKVDIRPFKIGQSIDEIYSRLYVQALVDITLDSSLYRFELSEEDMNMRPLIDLGNVFAQLYLDKFTGRVSSVRFLDDWTLVKQEPYEMTYRGALLKEKELSEADYKAIDEGNTKQIFDITNIMRKRFDRNPLIWDDETAAAASLHSVEMSETETLSSVSEAKDDISGRLREGNVKFKEAGENIAYDYIDAIAAVEGWINSKTHRDTLLDEKYTHLGVGSFKKNYTQSFISK
ncbi:CAP domain-containing protein [Bacillus massiliglaciei]|uniref:CAP domain-containing protein n=1 Tax=Bacillus massiliglaciei TaxID=1816693 RepID=UPI000A9ED63D|nr:CAP domain-containing protein [Bacillus massiliglaciei]